MGSIFIFISATLGRPMEGGGFAVVFIFEALDFEKQRCGMWPMCARQACGVHGHGEDQAGAAGQLHLVRQKEEAVQRQIFGQAQCRYAKITHACAHKHAVEKNVLFVRMLSIFFTALVSTCAGYWTVHPQQRCPTVFWTEELHFKQPTPMRSTPKKKKTFCEILRTSSESSRKTCFGS